MVHGGRGAECIFRVDDGREEKRREEKRREENREMRVGRRACLKYFTMSVASSCRNKIVMQQE